jgi:hypothetical protein
VVEGQIEHTQPMVFSAVEAIGADCRSRFTGHIPKLTIEVR